MEFNLADPKMESNWIIDISIFKNQKLTGIPHLERFEFFNFWGLKYCFPDAPFDSLKIHRFLQDIEIGNSLKFLTKPNAYLKHDRSAQLVSPTDGTL